MSAAPEFADPVLLAEAVLDGDVDCFDALWDSCGGYQSWGSPQNGTATQFSYALELAAERRLARSASTPAPQPSQPSKRPPVGHQRLVVADRPEGRGRRTCLDRFAGWLASPIAQWDVLVVALCLASVLTALVLGRR